MIDTWTYTVVPDRIDLEQPLMPLRDEDDNAIYGVDPAWLHEVLNVWNVIASAGSSMPVTEMLERPEAAFMNIIYNRAELIKNGSTNTFYKTVPASAFATMPAGVAFGDIHEEVSVGDPVRKTDISDVFDWMKDVKYAARGVGVSLPEFSYTASSDQEGSRSADEIGPPDSSVHDLYKWDWFYYETNGRLSHMNGGAWKRSFANSFSISIPLVGVKAAWFCAAHVFLPVTVWNEDGNRGEVFVPVGDGTISESGTSAAVSVTVDAAAAVQAAMAALGVSERAYKTEMETEEDTSQTPPIYTTGGSGGALASTRNYPIVFLELAKDYRHP